MFGIVAVLRVRVVCIVVVARQRNIFVKHWDTLTAVKIFRDAVTGVLNHRNDVI